ncbi:MAG: hypothetical protein R3284_12405, partial [Rubricoccaceae bacterium]|nr:hypothetical protein [Rubricoccaceae bacterium]
MTRALPIFKPALLEQAAEALSLKALGSIQHGSLELKLPDGSVQVYDSHKPGPHASLQVDSGQLFPRVLLGGEIAFGETYMDGLWESDDLTALLTLGILNRGAAPKALKKANDLSRFGSRRLHLSRRNTREGSRRNIESHYDLSNDFF